eukprot:6932369-Prymnesium_polylepis.1
MHSTREELALQPTHAFPARAVRARPPEPHRARRTARRTVATTRPSAARHAPDASRLRLVPGVAWRAPLAAAAPFEALGACQTVACATRGSERA